jgi:hypothetical protein
MRNNRYIDCYCFISRDYVQEKQSNIQLNDEKNYRETQADSCHRTLMMYTYIRMYQFVHGAYCSYSMFLSMKNK